MSKIGFDFPVVSGSCFQFEATKQQVVSRLRDLADGIEGGTLECKGVNLKLNDLGQAQFEISVCSPTK